MSKTLTEQERQEYRALTQEATRLIGAMRDADEYYERERLWTLLNDVEKQRNRIVGA